MCVCYHSITPIVIIIVDIFTLLNQYFVLLLLLNSILSLLNSLSIISYLFTVWFLSFIYLISMHHQNEPKLNQQIAFIILIFRSYSIEIALEFILLYFFSLFLLKVILLLFNSWVFITNVACTKTVKYFGI